MPIEDVDIPDDDTLTEWDLSAASLGESMTASAKAYGDTLIGMTFARTREWLRVEGDTAAFQKKILWQEELK